MPKRWCNSAELRRAQIESGLDITFCEVFLPLYVEEISSLKPKNILEIGCGTGHLSRALIPSGASITALEPSIGMFRVASEVLANTQINLFNSTTLSFKPHTKFELALSHLVAHVIEDEEDFFSRAYKLLNENGHFIFSIPHPCFYNQYKKLFGSDYHYMKKTQKNITFSITNDPSNPISGVPYYHRPLSSYINSLFKSGFLIKQIHEIFPSKEIQKKYGEYWESPRYCLFVCKKLNVF